MPLAKPKFHTVEAHGVDGATGAVLVVRAILDDTTAPPCIRWTWKVVSRNGTTMSCGRAKSEAGARAKSRQMLAKLREKGVITALPAASPAT